MRRYAIVALIAAGFSFKVATAVPVPDATPRTVTSPASVTSIQNAAAKPIALDRLFQVHDSHDASWAADGRSVIFSSDQGGRMNLWRQSLAGGPPQQITRSDDRQTAPTATRDGRWIIFQSDHGGAEMYDLYAVSPDGGEAVDLTNTDDVTETSPVPSWDSRWIAFGRRVNTEPSANAAVLDFSTRQVRILTHETDPSMNWSAVAFSRDGRRLIVDRTDDSRLVRAAVYSIDLRAGAVKRLTPDDEAYALASDLSADGRLVALTMETPDGRKQAAILDVATRRTHLVLPTAWEQWSGRFSPDGRTLLVVSNIDGRDVVYAYDLHSHRARNLALPVGTNTGSVDLPAYSPQGEMLLLAHQSGSTPKDYWVSDRSGRSPRQVTDLGRLPSASLPSTSIVHYRSGDGTMISAILWTPFNLPRDGKSAGVVLAHGGPIGQTSDSFSRTAAALASRGYFVLAPNPRGSSGYGRAFAEANRRDLGGGDLQDEVAGARFLAATGYVSAAHIGITGGSYGGYMTLIALAKTPDVWAAGVEEYGIVNWRTMYEHGSPALRLYQASLIGTPNEDPKVYDATSPLTYLGQVKAPLLVIQGENDIRVPAEEGRQVVDFIRKKGGIVDAHFYPNEGHGLYKPENQQDALQRLMDWFDKYLHG